MLINIVFKYKYYLMCLYWPGFCQSVRRTHDINMERLDSQFYLSSFTSH